jgi:signal transduction histidine kinase
MDLVVKETDRLNTIIEHFLTFARARPPSFEKVSLAKVVEDVADLVKTNPDFRKSIQLKTMIPAGDTSVRADPEQTKQVLLNLCLNSLNAMEDGGQLTIEVLEKANVLGVAVKDTGVGISRDQISRIFQPFYTTREKGIGLGLSIAHRIVEQHGGWIDVESAIGKGSRFTVWFPKFTSEKKGSDSYGW